LLDGESVTKSPRCYRSLILISPSFKGLDVEDESSLFMRGVLVNLDCLSNVILNRWWEWREGNPCLSRAWMSQLLWLCVINKWSS